MRVVLGFVTVGIALCSCLEPTQVDVTITTDLRCGAEETGMYQLQRTDVQVLVDGQTKTVGSKDGCSNKRVGNIVFVPGKSSGEVRLHVVGKVIGQPDPVSADRIVRFLPHQSLALEIELSSACVGVKCDAMQTCVRGNCVDIPSNVPPPDGGMPMLDAGRDANPILDANTLDAPNDALTLGDGSLDGNLIDGGSSKCPLSPLIATDIHWGFNEGVNATSIMDDSMLYGANLIPNVSLVLNAPCTTALSYSGSVLQNLSTTNWHPTPTLGIAFDFQYVSGVGTILERNAGKPGGWRFSVVNAKLVFDLWDDQSKSAAPPSVVLVGGKTRVWGTYSQGLVTLSAYNSNASQGLSLTLTGYNSDIFLGMQGIKFVMDELWLGR